LNRADRLAYMARVSSQIDGHPLA